MHEIGEPRARILIVEDSATQGAELAAVLEQAGFAVDVADDGKAGLEEIRGNTYDLVLSDVLMPGLDGHELCRRVRSDPATRHIPFILLTALTEPGDVLRGLESGADNYITKPWESEDLLRRVNDVLAKAAQRAAGSDEGDPIEIAFLGHSYRIAADRRQVLDYFTSTFENYLRTKQREWESQAAAAAERERHETAAALARVGKELLASLDTRETANRLCRLVVELLGCDRSHTFLRDPDSGDFVAAAGYGATPHEWRAMQGLRLPVASISRLLWQLGNGDLVWNVGDGGTAAEEEAYVPPLPGAAMVLCTALRRGGEIAGIQVAAYREAGHTFSTRQRELALGIAEVASLALENARLHEELERANRLKMDFVNTMSHELRTPLSVVLGYCQLLIEGTFGALAPEQSEALRRVEHNAEELNRLVSSILDLGRLERGCLPLLRTYVDAACIKQTLESEIGRSEPKPDVEFRIHVQPDLPSFYTDRTRLKVVLRNLIDNAFKFTERGAVTVDVAHADGEVEFTVSDTGIGIDPGVLPVIFECFRQGYDPLTRVHGGVGLGLYVVKRLVDELGGRIEVESRVGHGSTFRIRLPAEPAAVRGIGSAAGFPACAAAAPQS